MKKAWEAETELAAGLWRRFHSSPGVVGQQRGLAAVNRALHAAAGKYPLLAEVYGRWAPEQVSHWGGWSGLPLVGPASERAVVEGAPATAARPLESAASALPEDHLSTRVAASAAFPPDRAAIPLVHAAYVGGASSLRAANEAPVLATSAVSQPTLPVVRIAVPRIERRTVAASSGSELKLAERPTAPLVSSGGSLDQAVPPEAASVMRPQARKSGPRAAEVASSGAPERAASPTPLPSDTGIPAMLAHMAEQLPSVPAFSLKRPRAVPVITPLGPAPSPAQASVPTSEESGASVPSSRPPARPAVSPRSQFEAAKAAATVLPQPPVGRLPGLAKANGEFDTGARTPMVLSHAAANAQPARVDDRAHREAAAEPSSSAPPASAPGPVFEPDMDELKNELMRELQTRLAIERERRGWS